MIILFTSRNGLVNAFTALPTAPLPTHTTTKYVNTKTWLKSRKNFKVAPLLSAKDPAVGIAVSVAAAEEISFMEAMFPFLNYFLVSRRKLTQMFQIFTADVSKLYRLSLCAAIGYVLPNIAKSSRDLLSKGKAGTLLGVQPLQPGREYEQTKWYHLFNHIKQGLYLGAANDLIDCMLDSFAVLGFDMNLLQITSNGISSASFSIWAMFRYKWINNAVIDKVMKRNSKRKRLIMKETSNYVLYLTTAMNILNLMGFKYIFAFRTISAFGGIGKIILCVQHTEYI